MSYVRIKVRRGTESEWASADPSPVLAEGEIGFEIDTNKFKIGTGQTSWASLPYAAVDPSNLNNTLSDYILAADLGQAQGPAQLDVDGNLLIPKSSIIFEGPTDNSYETVLTVTDPTADRTLTLPNETGTIALTSSPTFTGTTTANNLTVTGNLTVQGTTTTLAAENIVISDKNIILGHVESPTDVTADGGGITVEGTSNKNFIWSNSLDAWDSTEYINVVEGKSYKINGVEVLSHNQVLGKNLPSSEIVGESNSQTLTNKTIDLANNIISGTVTEFNNALSGDNFVTIAGQETLTNKTLTSPTISSPTINISGTEVSSTEISYLSGVNGLIQNQLNDKANTNAPTFTGNVVLPTTTSIGNVSAAEIGYLDGVTSAIQTQINGKTSPEDIAELAQDAIGNSLGNGLKYTDSTGAIEPDLALSGGLYIEPGNKLAVDGYYVTFNSAEQTLTNKTLTSPKINENVSVTVTATELNYLDGTTSNIQDQLDDKAPLSSPSLTGTVIVEDLEISGSLTFSGTATQIDTNNLSVSDSLIYLANSQFSSDILDIGIYGAYGSPSDTEADHPHAGLIRDASDGKWKLISNGAEPSDNTIDFTGATYDTLKLGSVEASYVRLSGDPTNALDATTKEYVDLIDYVTSTDSSYTVSATNLYSTTEINNSSTVTVTIPNDASDTIFPIGSSMEFRQMGAGRLNFTVTSPATLVSTDSYTKTRTQYSSVFLEKRASNSWILTGDIDA